MASVEDAIRADPEWQEGARHHGHPGETVAEHVEDVLANVEQADSALREQLRVIAIVHDAMKHRVRWWLPGRTDHARIAARFAERYVSDPGVLKVIARHDDSFRAWRFGQRWRLWPVARFRARRLIADLGDDLDLFRAFYRADNETGSKSSDDRLWFEDLVIQAGRPHHRHRPQ